jgi:hypothetical protein
MILRIDKLEICEQYGTFCHFLIVSFREMLVKSKQKRVVAGENSEAQINQEFSQLLLCDLFSVELTQAAKISLQR